MEVGGELHVPNCFTPGEITPLSTKQEAVRAPQSVHTFPARNKTPDHPTRNLVTVSSELSQLQNFKISFIEEFCSFNPYPTNVENMVSS